MLAILLLPPGFRSATLAAFWGLELVVWMCSWNLPLVIARQVVVGSLGLALVLDLRGVAQRWQPALVAGLALAAQTPAQPPGLPLVSFAGGILTSQLLVTVLALPILNWTARLDSAASLRRALVAATIVACLLHSPAQPQ